MDDIIIITPMQIINPLETEDLDDKVYVDHGPLTIRCNEDTFLQHFKVILNNFRKITKNMFLQYQMQVQINNYTLLC